MLIVNGKEMEWKEGMTVADVITKLDPAIPFVFARVNGKVISKDEHEGYVLEDGSQVEIVSVIAGG